MKVLDAIASGLSYVQGLREIDAAGPAVEAQAFLDHLANHGFVVRSRQGAERLRRHPDALDRHNVSAGTIRAMRKEAGLSLAGLASLAGVAAETIGSWEKGRKCPHSSKLTAVMDALAQAKAGDGRGCAT